MKNKEKNCARVLISSAAFAFVVTCAYAQDPLEIQRARDKYVLDRAKDVHYTRQFNLDSLPRYVPEQEVAGLIRIWGSDYIGKGDLGKYWEEGFRKYHPLVEYSVNLRTDLIAIPGLVTGLADLATSRPITFDELNLFQRIFHYQPLEITMVTGSFNVSGWVVAATVAVHKDNPINKLTLKQLDGIFGTERTGGVQGLTWHPEVARSASENIRTWGQLGLTGEWKDKPIHVYGANLRFHLPRVFERIVFKGGTKWNEQLREYSNRSKPDGSLGLTSELIMADLGKDPYGIALSHGGIKDLTPQTKVLAIAAKEGGLYVELTIDSVQNRSYPLINEQYWYLNRRPGQPIDPKVKEFVKYSLSRQGQEAVMRDGKFLPLTAEVVRAQLKKLE